MVIRHGANPNLVDERGEVLQMLSTDHLAVGESVIEIVSCNERLLEHAKAREAQLNQARCFCDFFLVEAQLFIFLGCGNG